MPKERRCENCRFFEKKTHGNALHHECRFNPPSYSTVVKTIWPCVKLDDWCGKFESEQPSRTGLSKRVKGPYVVRKN